MIDLQAAQAARAHADTVASAAEVAAAYDRLAAALARKLRDANPLVLPVLIGGMIPAAELLRRCDFPLEIDTLHATRYRGAQRGAALEWRTRPRAEITGRHVVVVDDILDEGKTLLAIQAWLAEQDAASVTTVVLCDKDHDRRVPGAHADLVGLTVPDRYVFGTGMDLHGYFRQLPEILAVRAEDGA